MVYFEEHDTDMDHFQQSQTSKILSLTIVKVNVKENTVAYPNACTARIQRGGGSA